MGKTVNYNSGFNKFMEKEDRIGEPGCDSEKLASRIVAACGVGPLLDVGSGEGLLVGALLRQGVDAVGVDISDIVARRSNSRWPGRFCSGSALALPFHDGQFPTVVAIGLLENLAETDVISALRELHRVSSRFVFLEVAIDHEQDCCSPATVHGRTWWENLCFAAGFRKHPAYYAINSYENLNSEPSRIAVPLEKVPGVPDGGSSKAPLANEDLLHRDMLGETGRRSDAHCVRYFNAAPYVRRGDHVLDVGCGLGYGCYILACNSQARKVVGVDICEDSVGFARTRYGSVDLIEFFVGDGERLESIADNSVDFITSFEAIGHMENPEAFLAELKRVLRPAGRLMLCARNNWIDEAGDDPNPYPQQVYTWERLRSECEGEFLVEKCFLQTAGGAMKCHHSPRSWHEINIDVTPDEDAEWVVFLCMKSPLEHEDADYQETLWKLPESRDFNVSAFARDYNNPWLVKGMVSLSYRNLSPENLKRLQVAVIENSDPSSVDYGAALCGYIYGVLARIHVDHDQYEYLQDAARSYSRISRPTPHQLRWQVSLLFAGAELARTHGNFADAISMFEQCANVDVVPYSPLLGNRTLDALHWLSVFAIARGEHDKARGYLQKAVVECRRLCSGSWLNISGDENDPLPFGLAEMAQLMDKGARAAYMLTALDTCRVRPAVLLAQASGFLERQVVGLVRERDDLLEANAKLAREVSRQEKHANELAREISRQDAYAQKLARSLEQRRTGRNDSTELHQEGSQSTGPGMIMRIWRRFINKACRK